MKRILLIILILPNISIAQITFSNTLSYSEPSTLNSRYFYPVKITTKSDSIINGYGSLSFDNKSLRFIHTKPSINILLLKGQWSYYGAKKISNAEFTVEGKKYKIYPVVRKGDLGASVLFYQLYENSSLKLFCDISDMDELYNGYQLQKKGEKDSKLLVLDLSQDSEPMHKKVSKYFKTCPQLYNRLKKGEYKSSYEDFIEVLDYYDHQCNKGS